jgi:hypothetical protein
MAEDRCGHSRVATLVPVVNAENSRAKFNDDEQLDTEDYFWKARYALIPADVAVTAPPELVEPVAAHGTKLVERLELVGAHPVHLFVDVDLCEFPRPR